MVFCIYQPITSRFLGQKIVYLFPLDDDPHRMVGKNENGEVLLLSVYPYILKCMGTLSGKVTLLFTYLLPFTREVHSGWKEFAPRGAVHSERKEFAPRGANSFL